MRIILAQATPHMLVYRCEVRAAGEVDTLRATKLEADASRWRDRAIHKLVTTKVTTDADARRVFQGVGLVDADSVNVMRGRVWIQSETFEAWGFRVRVDPATPSRAEITLLGPRDLLNESAAMLYIELERNR